MIASELSLYTPWDALAEIPRILLISAIGGGIAIRAYHWYRSIETMDMRYRLAEALSVELVYIAEMTSPDGAFGRGFLPYSNTRRFDGMMYGGVVGSGGIAHFDIDTQRKLYRFYDHLKSDNKAAIQKEIVNVMNEVDEFKKRNRREGLRWYQRILGVKPQT